MSAPLLYWWSANGDKRGPMDLDRLRELVRNGSIPRNAIVWRSDWTDWRELESVAAALAIPQTTGRSVAEYVPAVRKRPVIWDVLFVLTIVVALGIGLVWNFGHDVAVKSRAESAVQSLLKSPSSAKFSNVVVTREADGVLVVGDVDSQNIYGAMLRSRWVVKLKDGAVVSASLIP